jgi:hypothetical protein
MFEALLAHPQEAFHQWHLVYCVHVMSVGCIRIGVELAMASSTPILVQPTDITCTQYSKCCCVVPSEDE